MRNKNEKKLNKDKWNYCHNFPILSLLGDNHRLLVLHMAKTFICIKETSDRIDEFEIGYMINTTFHVNKSLK